VKVLGLTGGIGMGKSTAAKALRRAGLLVFDADACVHALQGPNGKALPAIAALVPNAVREGRLDRAALRRAAVADPGVFRALERIIHPLVRAERNRFLQRARRQGRRWAVLDIPLLFEIAGPGGPRARRPDGYDLIAVVSAPRSVQLERVRRRRSMTRAEADAIIRRQMPDREKRRRADVVIRTGLSRWHGLTQVRRLLARMLSEDGRAG
jgi:dephospho-CoA kinase